jgi:hypothetical protein
MAYEAGFQPSFEYGLLWAVGLSCVGRILYGETAVHRVRHEWSKPSYASTLRVVM